MTSASNIQPVPVPDAAPTARMRAVAKVLGLATAKRAPKQEHMRRRAPDEVRDDLRAQVTDAMRRVVDAAYEAAGGAVDPAYSLVPLKASTDTITIEEDGRYYYRRITHVAELDGVRLFAFVFMRDGAIEAYRDFEGNDEWTSLGSRMGHRFHQCDPMLCLVYDERVAVVYNVPTVEMMEGTRNDRLPFVAADGDVAMGEGSLCAVGFATDASEETYKLFTRNSEIKYAVTVMPDGDDGAPQLVVYKHSGASSGRRGLRGSVGTTPDGLLAAGFTSSGGTAYSIPAGTSEALADAALSEDVALLNRELAPTPEL